MSSDHQKLCPECGLENRSDERGDQWQVFMPDALYSEFGPCKRCGWTEDRARANRAENQLATLRGVSTIAQIAGIAPSVIHAEALQAVKDITNVVVADRDRLKGWILSAVDCDVPIGGDIDGKWIFIQVPRESVVLPYCLKVTAPCPAGKHGDTYVVCGDCAEENMARARVPVPSNSGGG